MVQCRTVLYSVYDWSLSGVLGVFPFAQVLEMLILTLSVESIA